jgi:hypothetical protein
MTAPTVRYVGKHQHTLPSGRPIAFGDELKVGDDLDLTQTEADRLTTAGVLVEKPAPPKRATRTEKD